MGPKLCEQFNSRKRSQGGFASEGCRKLTMASEALAGRAASANPAKCYGFVVGRQFLGGTASRRRCLGYRVVKQ